MRLLLEAFRLPGEAGPIARITENFADIYFASDPRESCKALFDPPSHFTCPAEVKSTDAVYVLAYSVIMLNTDLYNPQNRVRNALKRASKCSINPL